MEYLANRTQYSMCVHFDALFIYFVRLLSACNVESYEHDLQISTAESMQNNMD